MIGDVLTSSILFEALREKYPGAVMHYLIYPHTRPVVENNPFIDHIIEYCPQEYRKPAKFIGFLKKIRKQQYDIVIDVYSKISTAFISKASGAAMRISYKKWYTSSLYTHPIQRNKEPETPAGLAIENRMQLLKALHKDFSKEIKPKVYLEKKEIAKAKERLILQKIDPERPLFMISVLGSSAEKTYPLKYMAQVLNGLVAATGANLLFNYIPKQKEEVTQIYRFCDSSTQKKIHLDVFGKDLREFLALTWHCDALLGNEGGAVNMAKAIEVPTFSIFSPQISKEAWATYENEKNQSVHLKDFKPQLFIASKKPFPKLYQQFTPDHVLQELLKFLKNVQRV